MCSINYTGDRALLVPLSHDFCTTVVVSSNVWLTFLLYLPINHGVGDIWT